MSRVVSFMSSPGRKPVTANEGKTVRSDDTSLLPRASDLTGLNRRRRKAHSYVFQIYVIFQLLFHMYLS